MLRILYVSHTHPPQGTILDNVGGMQRVSRQLIDELYSRNDVQVFTETVNVSGQGRIALKTAGFLLKQAVSLPAKIRKLNVDVVLFSSMVTASIAWFVRKRVDVPMVTINHGRDVTLQVGLYQRLVPRIFEALDGVISVSSATRAECVGRGMNPEKGVALSNGFNLDTMDDLPEKEDSRQALQKQFNIPLDENIMLLTVGRKVKRKGHEWFIRNVLPHISHDVVYVTVGDGPQLENVQQSAQQSSLREDIFLLGRQPDNILKQAYAAADLFIMPNIPVDGDMEGFGIVLLEANMAQTPAVAADLEGIKDVISSGKNGYKVPTLNADAFADTINKVLDSNLEELARQTRYHVQQKFAWKEVAEEYVDYLKEVVERHKATASKK